MPEMLSIGRFGALTGLTARALRLYDQLDLLRPAMVDFPSGYRYYSPEQVDVARAIGRLRAAQMPLLEVAELLRTDDEATIGSLLDRHRERLRKQIEAHEKALHHVPTVEEWYCSTGKGGTMDDEANRHRTCSFCGKERQEVRRMIAGPNGVVICNECVALCNDLLTQHEGEPAGQGERGS